MEALVAKLQVVDLGKPRGSGMKGRLRKLLTALWRPGQLFKDIEANGIQFVISNDQVLRLVVSHSEQILAAQYSQQQGGYWSDHWTYLLDLIDSYRSK